MYFICDIDIKEYLHVIPQYSNIGLFEEPEQFEDFLDYGLFEDKDYRSDGLETHRFGEEKNAWWAYIDGSLCVGER